jgi:hypothetical protein
MMLFAAAATSAVLLAAALAGHVELVAYVAPLLALALPLVAGRYLGEDALERLRVRREPARRRRAAPAMLTGVRRAAAAFPRGGRLIADALAERGPPARALT